MRSSRAPASFGSISSARTSDRRASAVRRSLSVDAALEPGDVGIVGAQGRGTLEGLERGGAMTAIGEDLRFETSQASASPGNSVATSRASVSAKGERVVSCSSLATASFAKGFCGLTVSALRASSSVVALNPASV